MNDNLNPNEKTSGSTGFAPSLGSQLPDSVIRTLRHCRLFIGERRGYRNSEEEERDDICRQLDEILSANVCDDLPGTDGGRGACKEDSQ